MQGLGFRVRHVGLRVLGSGVLNLGFIYTDLLCRVV